MHTVCVWYPYCGCGVNEASVHNSSTGMEVSAYECHRNTRKPVDNSNFCEVQSVPGSINSRVRPNKYIYANK